MNNKTSQEIRAAILGLDQLNDHEAIARLVAEYQVVLAAEKAATKKELVNPLDDDDTLDSRLKQGNSSSIEDELFVDGKFTGTLPDLPKVHHVAWTAVSFDHKGQTEYKYTKPLSGGNFFVPFARTKKNVTKGLLFFCKVCNAEGVVLKDDNGEDLKYAGNVYTEIFKLGVAYKGSLEFQMLNSEQAASLGTHDGDVKAYEVLMSVMPSETLLLANFGLEQKKSTAAKAVMSAMSKGNI